MIRWVTKRIGMFQHDDGPNNRKGMLTCELCSWSHVVTTDCVPDDVFATHISREHPAVVEREGIQSTPQGQDAREYFVRVSSGSGPANQTA